MKEDTEFKETTSRRQFTKAAVIAAIAAPIATFLASCTKQPPQSATPTPSPAPTEHPLDGDGSPITVGGGGGNRDKREPNVSCVFKEDPLYYYDTSGSSTAGNKKFKNKNGWKIRTFKIRSKEVWTDYSDQLPANGACSIVIQCEGDDTQVVIDGDAFGVGMNTKTYEKQSDGYYRNPNAGHFVRRVTLNDGHIPSPVDKFFDAADEALVCVDFVKPDKSMCGRPTPTPTP